MSEPNDPNAVYEPAPYPRMLYVTAARSIIVQDADEEAEARDQGYTEFHKVDPERDGLDTMSHEALIHMALGMMRTRLARMETADVIDGLREMRAEEAEIIKAAEAAQAADAPEAVATGGEPGSAEPQAGPPQELKPEIDQVGGIDAENQNSTTDAFDQMDKPALRAFIKGRDGKSAPGFFDEAKLRALARHPPAV